MHIFLYKLTKEKRKQKAQNNVQNKIIIYLLCYVIITDHANLRYGTNFRSLCKRTRRIRLWRTAYEHNFRISAWRW